MLEDKHIQMTCEYPDIDFDIILRVNDNKNKYIAVDIFDYRQQKTLKTIKIESKE
tara:strand:- start:298 stop:462 length:165 start_codon:yes stop_codon:yes gene_type:complete